MTRTTKLKKTKGEEEKEFDREPELFSHRISK